MRATWLCLLVVRVAPLRTSLRTDVSVTMRPFDGPHASATQAAHWLPEWRAASGRVRDRLRRLWLAQRDVLRRLWVAQRDVAGSTWLRSRRVAEWCVATSSRGAAAATNATRRGAALSTNATRRCAAYSRRACERGGELCANATARGLAAARRLARAPLRLWRGGGLAAGGPLDAAQRALLRALRDEVSSRPTLLRDARKGRMPLDDECLARYLSAARWQPRFPDRPVVDAIADTAQWRASCAAARQPEALKAPDPELRRMFWTGPRGLRTKRGEAVLLFHCRNCRQATLAHLVRVIEAGCRAGNGKCALVLDCRGAPATALFDTLGVIKPALPVFQRHYCGRLGRVVVLKSGKPGQTLWWIARKFCDAPTRSKIAFVEDSAKLAGLCRLADLDRDPTFAEASAAERLEAEAAPRGHTLYL